MHSIQFSSDHYKLFSLLIPSYIFNIKEARNVTVDDIIKFVTAKATAVNQTNKNDYQCASKHPRRARNF